MALVTVDVLGSDAGDARLRVALALAIYAAQSGRRVLLTDSANRYAGLLPTRLVDDGDVRLLSIHGLPPGSLAIVIAAPGLAADPGRLLTGRDFQVRTTTQAPAARAGSVVAVTGYDGELLAAADAGHAGATMVAAVPTAPTAKDDAARQRARATHAGLAAISVEMPLLGLPPGRMLAPWEVPALWQACAALLAQLDHERIEAPAPVDTRPLPEPLVVSATGIHRAAPVPPAPFAMPDTTAAGRQQLERRLAGMAAATAATIDQGNARLASLNQAAVERNQATSARDDDFWAGQARLHQEAHANLRTELAAQDAAWQERQALAATTAQEAARLADAQAAQRKSAREAAATAVVAIPADITDKVGAAHEAFGEMVGPADAPADAGFVPARIRGGASG